MYLRMNPRITASLLLCLTGCCVYKCKTNRMLKTTSDTKTSALTPKLSSMLVVDDAEGFWVAIAVLTEVPLEVATALVLVTAEVAEDDETAEVAVALVEEVVVVVVDAALAEVEVDVEVPLVVVVAARVVDVDVA